MLLKLKINVSRGKNMGTVEVRLVLSNPSTSVFKWPTSSAATTEKEEAGDWKKRGHRKQPTSSLAASLLPQPPSDGGEKAQNSSLSARASSRQLRVERKLQLPQCTKILPLAHKVPVDLASF